MAVSLGCVQVVEHHIVWHPVACEGPPGMGIIMQVDDAVGEFNPMLLILVATCGTLDTNSLY
jgi:hypothetical protein